MLPGVKGTDMRKMLTVAIVCCLLMACAENSGVVAIGNGVYMISGHSALASTSAGEEEATLAKIADAYCAKLGKTMVLDTANGHSGHNGAFGYANAAASNGYGGYGNASAFEVTRPAKLATGTITFRCQ